MQRNTQQQYKEIPDDLFNILQSLDKDNVEPPRQLEKLTAD